jgi:hypothetical protein
MCRIKKTPGFSGAGFFVLVRFPAGFPGFLKNGQGIIYYP